MSSFYTCTSKISIKGCMIPETWRAKDIIFVILGIFFFLPFYPTNNPENYNLEKIYKIPGDIILLQMCTIRSYDLWFLRYKT